MVLIKHQPDGSNYNTGSYAHPPLSITMSEITFDGSPTYGWLSGARGQRYSLLIQRTILEE